MAKRGEAKSRFDLDGLGLEQKASALVMNSPNTIEVRFNNPSRGVPHVVDLSSWLVVGSMAMELANAFAEEHKNSARQTRLSVWRNVTNGFINFLVLEGIKLNRPEDIPSGLMLQFFDHLKQRKTPDGEQVANQTRLQYWRYAATLIDRVTRKFPQISLDMPKRPFAGTNFKPKDAPAPDRDAIANTLSTAAADALEVILFVDPLLPHVAKALEQIVDGHHYDPTKIEEVAAALLLMHEEGVPTKRELAGTAMGDAVDRHGYLMVRRLVAPSANDVMPFFLLMAGHSGWNEQPLAHLKLSNCVVTSLLGTERFTISSEKFRANSIVRRSFAITEKLLSPYEIVEFVKRWTSNLRSRSRILVQDDLWLHRVSTSRRKADNPSPIDSLAGRYREGGLTPSNYVQSYCKQRGLKFTGLRELRQSFSEAVSKATGGDALALREMLGHTRLSVTNSHYRTAEMQQREAEALAGMQTARERWVWSSGKVDTRNASSRRDQTAATPGFICMDPFDSPRHGQRKGRMCYAYGHCPSCPLAVSDPDLGYALGRFLQLDKLYEEAKDRLGIEVWKAKFSRDSAQLKDYWIPAISAPATRQAAGDLLLPSLPKLE